MAERVKVLVIPEAGRRHPATTQALAQAGFDAVDDAGQWPPARGDTPPARLEERLARSSAACDRMARGGEGAMPALYGDGSGALIALALAMARADVAALVLGRPPRKVSRLQRVLLLRERFRLGSDMPSRVMGDRGARTVGDWLAIGAMQHALRRTISSEARRDLPILIVGEAKAAVWIEELLQGRSIGRIERLEAVGEAADGVETWLSRVLA